MNMQIIKSLEGKAEYVLLPIAAYHVLKHAIDDALAQQYDAFNIEDYVTNPVALARIRANLTQEELATRMKVSQAYISKLESQATITPKVLAKVNVAINQ